MAKADPLARYKAKRDFSVTGEPADGGRANRSAPSFVVQKHWARRLHYDFRLELDGAMKSWAVPKGPSYDPADKRMAMHVEDHPISYNTFEGEIPPRQYGAGKVIIWDKGTWQPLGDARSDYREGKLKFELHGHKLKGRWALVRMKGKAPQRDAWLLIKEKDAFVRSSVDFSVVDEMPDSVARLPPPASPGAARARAPAGPRGAGEAGVKAALPETLEPQLATLTDRPPADADAWLYEIKFDGYRLLARVEAGQARLFTRNGNDWTERLPHLAAEFGRRRLPSGWYDGEIVVLDAHGVPDFQALQGAFDAQKTRRIVYYLFDLPYSQGRDLRAQPLEERRERLAALLRETEGEGDALRYSAAFDVDARDIVASACRLGLEGVIGKRRSSPYTSRRSGDWIKLKCSLRQEFVIGGYTDPQGSREGIGSLLLGVHDEQGELRYAGNVGTGFDRRTLADLREKLDALGAQTRPFAQSTGMDRKAHWVRPELLAEVSFGQWTETGRIRHSVFHGLRSDKPAKAITRENSMTIAASPDTLKVTHPERVIDPSSGARKIDVARHYALVGELMLPHLKGRPVSLVRAPDGVGGEMFFQKHMDKPTMAGVRLLSQDLDPDHEPLMEVAAARGLLSAAQMNVIEFHTWNAVKTRIDRPDRMTFDLDPGKGVEWPAMQEAALVLRAFLQELELAPFVKTSGGKGLHVVVPLQRRHNWDLVKDFSQAVVRHLARTFPRRFSAKSGPRNRVGKIFIDYLRNGFGATTVAAWSLRARPGMGVSVPIAWSEVDALQSSAQWHIHNIHERLDQGNAPWRDYGDSARTLTAAMKTLGFQPDR
ncbi:MAG TPA: DNA ligase D [Castellaniella sp.]|nr:DNA ligase D [Castellaniella sp.]